MYDYYCTCIITRPSYYYCNDVVFHHLPFAVSSMVIRVTLADSESFRVPNTLTHTVNVTSASVTSGESSICSKGARERQRQKYY